MEFSAQIGSFVTLVISNKVFLIGYSVHDVLLGGMALDPRYFN